MPQSSLFVFGWPSHIGGAGTKLAHLLRLLVQLAPQVTVIPNTKTQLADLEWHEQIRRLGANVALREELPQDAQGWALALCNDAFFKEGIARTMHYQGLKTIWSSEMMWHFPAEVGAVFFGWLDMVLYTSPVQREMLEPGYLHALSNGVTPLDIVPLKDPDATEGILCSEHTGKTLRWVMTGNYIDSAEFPFVERTGGRPFTAGRISRPDPDKFPDDFPDSYERLGLREPCRFRVMGWSEVLQSRWPDHRFDERWNLLPPGAESTVAFLHSLDVMIHDVSPRLRESWGRSTVEAMLTGAVPLVPKGGGHHLKHLVPHGVGGFHCEGPADFARYARLLQDHPELLRRMSRAGREWAVRELCSEAAHLERWRRVFS